MVKVVVAAALSALFWARAATGALSEETPAEFANRFYHAYGALRVRGVPSEQQRRVLSPFFTIELRELLARLARQNRPCREGDLFTSNTAGCADTYAIGFPHAAIGRLILPIHLADRDTGDAWVDQLVLHHGDGRWFIADIVYTDDRPNRLFGKGSFRRVLKRCLHR